MSMYSFPEYLNASQRVAVDLFTRAHQIDPMRFPFDRAHFSVEVYADSRTGTASVDWKITTRWNKEDYLKVVINLPVKPATYMVTEQEFNHGIAYLLHECGHPFHTCKRTWDAAVARRAHNLLNALEDVREEKATIDMGLAVNALEMFSSLIDSLHAKAVKDHYNPNDVRSIGWTLSTLGRAANGYKVDCSDIYGRLDPNGLVFRICGWALPKLKLCQSTQDCLDLADEVTDAVRKAQQAKQPIQPAIDAFKELLEDLQVEEADTDTQEPAGSDFEDFGDDDTAEEETLASEPAEGEVDLGPGGVGGDEQQAGEANEGGTPDHQSHVSPDPYEEPKPEPEQPADEIFDDVDLTPNKTEAITSGQREYHAAATVVQEIRRALNGTLVDKPIVGREVMHADRKNRSSVQIVTADASKMGKARALLAQALKREETDDREGGRLHGRLDRRAMSRLVQGNPHVFAKRTVTEGYDTDVEILVDGSTSMSGKSILAAATCALTVAQACAQVGVQCSARVFTDNGFHLMTKGRAKPIARKFAYAFNQVDGSTPLTQSLLKVAVAQKARVPNKRRIIFLVTDGGCDMGSDCVKAAGVYVERILQCEIANLHIGYMPMGLFRNEVAVDVNDVTATGLRSLTQVLERGL